MARLTARFEMIDKVSRKLRAITGNMENLVRRRREAERPIYIRIRDEATRELRRISRFADRNLRERRTLTVRMRDEFTRRAEGINRYLHRRIPTSWAIVIEARNRTQTVLESIRRYTRRHFARPVYLLMEARDRATGVMHRIANYARRSLSRGYNFSVRAIDIASRTVGRIASYARTAIPRYRDFSIRAFDKATSVVGSIKRALFSIPSLITVTLAVVGLKNIKESTIGAAMQFEGYQVAMDHWLDGNKKKADDLITWMGRLADKTPFSSPDLFPALTRGIGLAEGDVKQAKKLLRTAADMSALTPGTTVVDAMEALGDAQVGEFERMKAYNMKFSEKELEIVGWDRILGEIADKFDGGSEKLSATSQGIISTLQGYRSSIMRSFGTGFLEPMKPRLDAVSKWLDNNQDKWQKWKSTVQKVGTDASEWLFSKLENGFSHIQNNYLENDKFMKMDFEGKVKFIMDDLGKWWDKTGQPLMVQVSKDIGSAVFDGMVWGIKEGIKGLGGLWGEAFKDPSLGNFGAAAIGTAIAGSIASIVLSPLTKGIGQLFKGGKWFWGQGKKVVGMFRRGGTDTRPPLPNSSGRPPSGGPPPAGGGPNPSNRPPRNERRLPRNGRPEYRQPWFNRGERVAPLRPNAFKDASKLSKVLKPLGSLAKRVPYLGTAIGAVTLATASKKDKPKVAGGVAGGLAGAGTGAAIGSVIAPGPGTVIGGLIGGIAGTFGGEALGGWLGDHWDTVKQKASDAGTWISGTFSGVKDSLSETIFNGGWWGEKWDGVKGWTSQKLSDTSEWWSGVMQTASDTLFSADWWIEKAGFIYGYLEETLFNGEWWMGKWDSVKTWTSEKLAGFNEVWETVKTAFSDTVFNSEWWYGKWQGVQDWTSEKWAGAVDIWNSISEAIGTTVFNADWWLGKWDAVSAWTSEKWDAARTIWDGVQTTIGSTLFNGDWWLGKWDAVNAWASDKMDQAQEIWAIARDGIAETLFSKDWWTDKWDGVVGWTKDALSGIGSWVSDLVQGVKEKFTEGREKGREAASKPRTAANHKPRSVAERNPLEMPKRYANGGVINRPHLGLVGEAGPEAIIPLSSERRDRALDLYAQTGQALGVRPYANGGIVGGSVSAPEAQSATASVNVSGITVQGNTEEAQQYGAAFSTSVAQGINSNVISLDTWKQNNIQLPMQSVVGEAVGFGAGTVNSFAAGQNASVTGTDAYLNTQVSAPFSRTVAQGTPLGAKMISNFVTGVNSMSGPAKGAITSLGNEMIGGLAKVLNGLTSGLNTVMGSIGVKTKLAAWNPPKYAKGTDSHPGGLARVGDGNMHELIRTPNGQVSMSPNRDTLVNLPKGTEVLSGPKTKALMNGGLPAYKDGIGFDDVGGKFQSKLGDVFSYMGDPDKLIDDVLSVAGNKLPDIGGAFGDMSKTAFDSVKSKMTEWVSDKFSEFGGMDTFSGLTRTSGYGMRGNPFGGGGEFHKGIDFAGPLGTPIRANVSGRVIQAGYGANGSGYGGYGNVVALSSGLYTHLYAHLQSVLASVGQQITAGSVIGTLGSTGQSTGPHLHYEVRKAGSMQTVNPEQFLGGGAMGGAGGSQRWAGLATRALQMTGQFTPANLNRMLMQMQTESRGNPNAINLWDSNARKGIPSKGLMQVIDPTFRANAMPGYNSNIYDPLSNMLASIRYSLKTYGSLGNAWRGVGYAKGGVVGNDHIARVGEGNKREVIIPLEQHRNRALGLLGYAQEKLGVNGQTLSEGQALAVRSAGGGTKAIGQKQSPEVKVYITGDNHYSNEMDAERVGEIAWETINKKLEEQYYEGGEVLVDG